MDKSTLARWRALPASAVLQAICDHAKVDPTYRPTKDQTSQRWHVSVATHDYELIVTGPRFWDTRAGHGGGGAIDLVCHLLGCTVVEALRRLAATGM